MVELIKIGCGGKKLALMRHLLLKTALVRSKLKPAEIFSIQRCYRAEMPDKSGCEICAGQQEVLEKLGLPWKTLRGGEEKSLVLFYDSDLLEKTLENTEVSGYFSSLGYTNSKNSTAVLNQLRDRFSQVFFPHEIGLLLGYPLKDVAGFMEGKSRPAYRGSWMVYGDVAPSLKIMRRFQWATRAAEEIVNQYEDWNACVEKIRSLSSMVKENEICLI